MNQIKSLLRQCHSFEDHPVYHPERYLINHILIVTLRAVLITDNPNLVMTAIIHDLFKPQGTQLKETPEGKYISNPDHPKQAYEFIHNNDDVKYWIRNFKADYNIVAELCKWHMACKDEIVKGAKHLADIEMFVTLDDMVGRKQLPLVRRDLYVPFTNTDGNWVQKQIEYIGIAPIHRTFKKQILTVTVERFPMRFEFHQVPEFFVNKWADLKQLFI